MLQGSVVVRIFLLVWSVLMGYKYCKRRSNFSRKGIAVGFSAVFCVGMFGGSYAGAMDVAPLTILSDRIKKFNIRGSCSKEGVCKFFFVLSVICASVTSIILAIATSWPKETNTYNQENKEVKDENEEENKWRIKRMEIVVTRK